METVYRSESPGQTEQIAGELAGMLSGMIALFGQMGAGKTAFVRGFVRTLSEETRVSSPTYTVMNCYSPSLYHLDLYRIASEEDLESIGFYDIPRDATVLCEWAEHLPPDVQVDARVYLEAGDTADTRIIKVVY